MNRIFKLVIFISSLNFGDCVVGGERVEDTTSHPYQAILSYEDKPACGGTIISKKHILTDARCFFNLLGGSVTSKQWVARVGSIQGNKGGTVIPVEKIHLPDKYNGEPEMNVALAALRAQINETKYVALIAMPTKDDVTGKTDLILTGYGINEVTRPRKYRYYLHRVKLTTMDFDSCKKVLPDVNFGNYTFCAQSSSPAGACFVSTIFYIIFKFKIFSVFK